MGVVLVAVVGAVLIVTTGVLGAAGILVERHRVAQAADAAALAAADAASGLVAGRPCDRAAEVAGAVSVGVADCVVDGSTVTVVASSGPSLIPIAVAATAGQPVSADSGSTDDSKK
ncbi:Rv3654c family TadE-like protein [Frondihabitans australicus]|uniref:Secretion/DNA translocation related TadE-like protein n=1 Tax=Frondihabitans australicus TaxID=386892 RepID=A0A495ICF9_9MICO|nr:Rv3654c family TadE-like protein [Frondihabitans australicus]RKR73158.1 secretion/DNA translocation related TadE-like protein [Frondihabitans australicus]